MKIPKWIVAAILIVSFLGFLDSAYLTVEHYSGGTLECNIFQGCDKVTSSVYSTILGIPVALMGAIYYLFIFVCALLCVDNRSEKSIYLASWLTIAGLLFSAWFVFAQGVLIKAWCQYCLFSAVTSTGLFILGMLLLYKRKSNQNNGQQLPTGTE